MTDGARRKQLKTEYRDSPPQAGVYRFVNSRTGGVLVGSARNLDAVRNKLKFARSTRSASTLDRRLQADAQQFGVEVFTLEILETLDVGSQRSAAELDGELETLEALYCEEQDQSLLY